MITMQVKMEHSSTFGRLTGLPRSALAGVLV